MAWLLEYTEDGVECAIEESHCGKYANDVETVLNECRGKLGVWTDIKLQYDEWGGDVEEFYAKLPEALADTSEKKNEILGSHPQEPEIPAKKESLVSKIKKRWKSFSSQEFEP
jgi:hypothetical protein